MGFKASDNSEINSYTCGNYLYIIKLYIIYKYINKFIYYM